MQILDTVSQKLTEMLGPFGPLMALGMLGVLLILLVLPALLNKDEDPLEKLKSSNQANQDRTQGTRLRVGERIGDATVDSIEPGRVVMTRGGERIELHIDTHLTHHNNESRD